MKFIFLVFAFTGSFYVSNAFANQHGDTKQLVERINTLEQRILALESRLSFATFMPDFAERFHVMHRASDAGDWAVASHQLAVMKDMIESSININAERGNLLKAMMGPVIEKMSSAIDHSSKEKFTPLLGEAVQVCNSCHVATGSAFIKVTLDSAHAMSMRHPHVLTSQEAAPHGH